MADFEITFNNVQLVEGAEAAFQSANELLGVQFTRRITDNDWEWPTEPSPRDIVDTGQLRNSYSPIPMPPTEYEHAWDTEYAMAVHEGAVFEDGHTMPARPWVRRTFDEFDFADAYGKLAALEMRKRTGTS